ncbi:MAG: fimbrillin family protein [Tannerellaceae bacterium]|jgi:hypothetical protein|nr:fimbrillin family protein [Tannerellaceae bacterium]
MQTKISNQKTQNNPFFIFRWLPAVAAAVLLTGCVAEEEMIRDGEGTGDASVRFNAGIDIETRVSNPEGNQWDATDTIGVYMIKANGTLNDEAIREEAKNKPYTVSSGAGTSTASFVTASDTTYYPTGEDVNFVSYYPYSGQETVVTADYKYMMDISDQSRPERLDLLYSNNKTAYNRNNHDADLYFEHLMTRIVFDASSTGSSDESLEELQLVIENVNPSTAFDLSNGDPASDGVGESQIIPITRSVTKDLVRMEATLIPTENASSIHLTFTLNGKTYSASLPPTATGNALVKGKRYTYKVLFGEPELSIEGHLSAWDEEPGGSIAPDPPSTMNLQIEGYSGEPVTVRYTSGDQETLTLDTDGKADLYRMRSDAVYSLTLGDPDNPILIGRKVENNKLLSLKVDDTGNLILRDSVDGYAPIGSYAEFQLINEVANLGHRYKQEAALDLMGENWTPIGNQENKFTGEYDGGEFDITNLNIDGTKDRVGLFGEIENAALHNIRLVSGTVNGNNYVGGICGYINVSTITNSHSNVTVTGTGMAVGGISGEGETSSTITSCRNTGNVTGSERVAGILGAAGYVTVKDCENSGEIAGGSGIAGIAGRCNATTIIACRNSGSIIGSSYSNYSGGIAGYNLGYYLIITACYNTGTVNNSGGGESGGIVGSLDFEGSSISACYNTGTVTGGDDNYIGLICGYYDLSYDIAITSCYWTKGDSDVSRGVGSGTDTTEEFSATAWPDASMSGWGWGNGEADNTYWKSLGGWNDGTPKYPTLHWE